MRRVIAVAGVLSAALLPALLTTGCGLGQDVNGFVTSKYSRAANLDTGTARAFTAPGARQSVATAIANATNPLDRLERASATYLQYKNAMVRVAPNGGGSVIQIDAYGNGYRRWAGDVAPSWGAYPSDDDDYDGK